MYILAIETTGAFASVALAKADQPGSEVQILCRVNGHDRFSHLQNLTPQIKQVLDEAGIAISDLDLIAVSKGPGSFTGIRIGVSTARALCQALNIPCVGVPSLDALAMRAEAEEGTLVCPILDARRSQVYGGGYFFRDGFPVEEVKAGPYTLAEFLEAVKDYDVLFLGDGVDKYGEDIKEARAGKTGFAQIYQEAPEVAWLGYRMQELGETVTFDKLQPEYMRMAEAERKLREKQGK